MAIKGILQIKLIWLLIICMAGCAVSTDFNENGNSIPDDWLISVSNEPNECISIDGDYQNFGLGKLKEGGELIQTRLDVALGYAFPSSKIPKQVSVSIDEDVNKFNYQFGHPINRSFSTSASCSDGWYKLEMRLTNQYVGDGANLDYSNRNIELGKTVDGDLIVHLILETQFSSLLVLKSRDKKEIWSKYEKSKREH